MGSGCCKKTKIADASLAVVQTQNIVATETPFGYVFIYPGVLTPRKTYTCPVLSIHTYRQASEKTSIDYAKVQFSNKKKYDQQVGPMAAFREEYLQSDETVIMIPAEDIVNIYYTSDVRRSVKAQEHSRLVPVVATKGCCGGFCCCKKAPKPVRQIELLEEKNAQREITVHVQYSKYSNLDTISNVRLLPESDRTQFYRNHFQPHTELKFYLVRNTEYDSANFERKKAQAESLCRIIMQLKGMNVGFTGNNPDSSTKENTRVLAPTAAISYPSPQELQQILNQSHSGIFGDSHQERFHSIETQQDFGTHVPAPITTTVIASVAMRPTTTPMKEID